MCGGMNQSRFQKIHESGIAFVKKHSMDDCSNKSGLTNEVKGGVEKK